jgi:hypothetical protein
MSNGSDLLAKSKGAATGNNRQKQIRASQKAGRKIAEEYDANKKKKPRRRAGAKKDVLNENEAGQLRQVMGDIPPAKSSVAGRIRRTEKNLGYR